MLPQLRELERAFADELVVIGVHSAKFPAEGVPANLRATTQRLGLHHPVVNDADHAIWDQYAVRAWPTLMFIDPRGYLFAKHEGEFPLDAVMQLLAEAVARFDAQGAIDRRAVLTDPLPPGGDILRFPGKVLVDADGGRDRLFIADSGHHRVVVTTLTGTITGVYGDGTAGLVDGAAGSARFNQPLGLALDPAGETLFVADSENHAIRAIALRGGRVTTVAGTGQQASERSAGGLAREVALSSPWDVAIDGHRLWIAMAGTHQLWTLDLHAGRIALAAGTGAESIHDGPPLQAAFAQPSGLAIHDGDVYVADSESSAVRRVSEREGRVRRLLGRGLFEFGDLDGAGDRARLQHPLGIAVDSTGGDPVVYLADSYTDKVKRLDPATRAVTTIAGSAPGHVDGPLGQARFWEPSGLSYAWGRLYVADTNNHAIRIVDLDAGTVETLHVRAP